MRASKHAVFVGPGKLPRELREVIARRAGAPQADLFVAAPRLLAVFDTAADAERIANQVQRLKIPAAVAGPEQPPLELAWHEVSQATLGPEGWELTWSSGVHRLTPSRVTSLSVIDWRPEGAADRAVLMFTKDHDRAFFLRAQTLGGGTIANGLRTVAAVLDACMAAAEPDVRLRSRRVAPTELEQAGFTGDLLPLALAMIDRLDTAQATLSVPLARRNEVALNVERPHALARPVSAMLWGAAALLGATSLTLLTICGGFVWSVSGLLLGLATFCWAAQRLYWARSLALTSGATRTPRFPLNEAETGQSPRLLGVGLDVGLFAAAWLSTTGPQPIGAIATGLLFTSPLWAGLSATALWAKDRG